MTRWCYWCGHLTDVGGHYPDGSFNPYSVPVSAEEIDAAINAHVRKGHARPSFDSRQRTAYAIALGKHSGSYNPPQPKPKRPKAHRIEATTAEIVLLRLLRARAGAMGVSVATLSDATRRAVEQAAGMVAP